LIAKEHKQMAFAPARSTNRSWSSAVTGATDDDSRAAYSQNSSQGSRDSDMEELKTMMKTLLRQNEEDKKLLQSTRHEAMIMVYRCSIG
jgi:pullulanase/glycogen debranching enzyme